MIKQRLKGSYNTKQSYLAHILFYNEAKRNKMNYATISTCKNCVIGYRGVRVTNNTVIPPVSRYLKHFPPEWILAIIKIACIQDNLSSRARSA